MIGSESPVYRDQRQMFVPCVCPTFTTFLLPQHVCGFVDAFLAAERWHLQWTSEFGEGYSGSGYSIQNLKSKRNILDGSAGLMATEGIAAGSFWWLISQERDELGHFNSNMQR